MRLPVPSYATRSARVAELADAPDLGSGGETRGGSSPPFRTNSYEVQSFSDVLTVPSLCPLPNLSPLVCLHVSLDISGRIAKL